jgi:hypothetical protein
MDQDLERSEVIELLVRLGEPEDEVVLQAARELHEKVSGAGFDWDTLLAPDKGDEFDDDLDEEDEDENSASFRVPASDTDGSLALIETLLTDKNISDALREELEGYKEDIGENDFTESDAAYLATLAARLKKEGGA